MMRRSLYLAAIIALGVVATESRAECLGGGGFGFGGFGGCGYGAFDYGQYGVFNGLWGGNPYAFGRIPTPPYFALHPPVYYSHPVPRPYGFSPFPYPGWVPTPSYLEEEVPAEPAIIDNPHIEGTGIVPPGEVESDDGIASTEPQVILNPFIVSNMPRTELAKTDN